MPDDVPSGLYDGGWPPPNMDQVGHLPNRHESPFRASHEAALPKVGSDPLSRRVIVTCAVAVAASTAGLLALVVPSRDADDVQRGLPLPPATESTLFPPTNPQASLPASPSNGLPSEVRTTTASTSPPATGRPAATTPSRAVTPASIPDLTIGATIGLEVVGEPGLRVRHHDFIARVDRLSSASSALDKAESRFIVRRGLAFDGCVSFEAVSYPGYYLRRFFDDLLLHERSNSSIYEQEVTFCPIPTRNGKGLTLLVLFPSGFTVAAAPDGRLHLDSSDETVPTAFVVRQPL